MPEEKQIQDAMAAPLAALEELLMAPAQALRQGVQRMNQTAERSRLPKLPELPEPPRLFKR
mgnify:CR=1 FL=1